jgi:hypothetical protein
MFHYRSSALSRCLDRAHWAAEQKRQSHKSADRKFWSDAEAKWLAHADRYDIRRAPVTVTRLAEADPVEVYDRAALNRRLGRVPPAD